MLSRIFDYISNLEIVQHQSSITPDCSVGVLCADEELKTPALQVRITQFLLVTRAVTVTEFGCGHYLLQR